MAGYIGSKSSVTLVDGYSEAEADAEFVTKTGDSMTGNLSLGDNNKAIFGAGSDLEIYHDGSHSYIVDAGTGNMYISTNGNGIVMQASLNEIMFVALPNGAVTLYHDNATKLATTATGIQVTGNIANASGDFTLDVAGDIILDADGADIRLSDAGTQFGKFTNSSSDFVISSSVNDKDMIFKGADGGSDVTALTLDMSDAGTAVFNNNLVMPGSIYHTGDTNTFFGFQSADTFTVNTAGTERMRIDSSGNLLAGKTSTSIATSGLVYFPTSALNVTRSGGASINLNRLTSDGDTITFHKDGTDVGSINVTGSATSYTTSSDYRLKENVVDLTGASARVNQLDVKRFNFIADDTNTLVDGFLAHEVATVVPEAITGTKDAMMDEEYEVTPAVLDEDGNVTTEAVMGTRSVPDYQGIDQSKLVPLLTAALQEALTEIASLKTRVEALEA